MKHGIRLTALIILVWSTVLSASVHETLPSWHWAYSYIEELRVRGGFQDLNMMNRPFTRGEVAEGVIKIQGRLEKGEHHFSESDRRMLDLLIREFRKELEEIHEKGHDRVIMGLRLQSDLDKPGDDDGKYRGVYRTKLSVPVGQHLTIYNGINFDQYLVDDSTYIGKTWRGMVCYSEQAYAAVNVGRFRFKFGRDFLRWGPGQNGTLIFSDVARPLDHLLASARIGPFTFSFIASALEDKILCEEEAQKYGGVNAKRYISAHRLDANLFGGRLLWSITEVLVYGGVNRQINWNYMNPFLFYHLSQLNNGGRANTIASIDLSVYPFRRWQIYGSLLVDQEMHTKKTVVDELEPPQNCLLIGSKWADPFRFHGFTLMIEYVKVKNRTYKTAHPYETFSHRNVTLGHPFGNDFDYLNVGASKWFYGNLWIQMSYGIMRNGEGDVFTAWDEPWENVSVEQGYSEPFPTGIVQKSGQFSLKARYIPSVHWGVNAEFHSWSLDNADHVQGESRQDTSWRIGFWLDGDVILKLGG